MLGLRFQIRFPDGRVEAMAIDADRVMIGSGAHCEIRLPLDQAKVEHVSLTIAGNQVRAEARAFEPPATVNGVPLSQSILQSGSVLGVGQTQIMVEVAEVGLGAGQNVANKNQEKTSPVTLALGGILLVAGAGMLLFPSGDGGDQITPPAKTPELWGPPETVCPQKDPNGALQYARDHRLLADGKRERRPFRVQDGVAAVYEYERSGACFRVGGEAPLAAESVEVAKRLRQTIQEDYRTHQVRLEYTLSRNFHTEAQHEVHVLLDMLDGRTDDEKRKAPEFSTYLSQLDRSLRLKIATERPQ
jgi:hypothetical protein